MDGLDEGHIDFVYVERGNWTHPVERKLPYGWDFIDFPAVQIANTKRLLEIADGIEVGGGIEDYKTAEDIREAIYT